VTLADFLHALGVLALGALGWFTLEFLGRPIREFFSLRREVRQFMLLHWDDISADQLIDPEEMTEWREKLVSTRATFSNLGARLGAFDQGEPFASWVVMKMGFNLPKAAGNLRNLGIGFGARMEDREEIFKKMDAALKFRINPKQRNFYNPHNVGR
jgi:hypothetical protein